LPQKALFGPIFAIFLSQWFGHYFGKKEATIPINTGFFLFNASYVFD